MRAALVILLVTVLGAGCTLAQPVPPAPSPVVPAEPCELEWGWLSRGTPVERTVVETGRHSVMSRGQPADDRERRICATLLHLRT